MQPGLPFYVPFSPFQHSRAGFEKIPQNLSRTELFQYFTFSPEDRAEILQCRGDHNRIGFSLLLGGVRLMGRFPLDFTLVPRSLLMHICEQLELESPLFVVYPQRQPTRYEHVERLKTYLGLRLFTPQDAQQLTADVRHHVRAGIRLHELVPTIEQQLRTQGVVLPGVTVLERLVNLARGAAEEELFVELAASPGDPPRGVRPQRPPLCLAGTVCRFPERLTDTSNSPLSRTETDRLTALLVMAAAHAVNRCGSDDQ